MSSSRLGVLVLALILLTATLLGGCESTHQYLLAKGYPPAYADGFDDGCGSGRLAAGSISGEFRKDVPRYLREAIYASGWGDGFEQCRSMARSEERRRFEERQWDDRDDDWQRDRDRALARALRQR
ncbi:hypothetical protein [Pseudomonas aeruginosa]|uniref:hypothetical protein n=1 Tax=Pseudomonas aeruginosa TaxID=287 RepID=UPI00106AC6D7|nr:hypothetical protein [Pseudomonas aeruginosa]